MNVYSKTTCTDGFIPCASRKKTRVNLQNTYQKPPCLEPKKGFHMFTMDDMFGYVPREAREGKEDK